MVYGSRSNFKNASRGLKKRIRRRPPMTLSEDRHIGSICVRKPLHRSSELVVGRERSNIHEKPLPFWLNLVPDPRFRFVFCYHLWLPDPLPFKKCQLQLSLATQTACLRNLSARGVCIFQYVSHDCR